MFNIDDSVHEVITQRTMLAVVAHGRHSTSIPFHPSVF